MENKCKYLFGNGFVNENNRENYSSFNDYDCFGNETD